MKKSRTAPKPSLFDEAKNRLHLDADGKPCVTSEMLMKALINAGVFIRLDGKRQLSKSDSSYLPGLLMLEDETYRLLAPGKEGQESKWGLAEWKYDVKKGKNPNGGEAVCIVRPLFEKWAIVVTFTVDIAELPPDQYRRLFDLAGSRMGLGDFRPQCKGRFGTFRVQCWKSLGTVEPEMSKAA